MKRRGTRVKLSRAQKLENDLNRWLAKKEAAITMLCKAMEQLKTLQRSQARMQRTAQLPAPPPQVRVGEEAIAPPPSPPPVEDDDLPEFLRRGQAAQAAVIAEQAAIKHDKANKRITKMKAKESVKQAELTGARRKMPLSGKEALAAIRKG